MFDGAAATSSVAPLALAMGWPFDRRLPLGTRGLIQLTPRSASPVSYRIRTRARRVARTAGQVPPRLYARAG